MRVIGIDPWTTTVWYALIEINENEKLLLDYGVIHTEPKLPFEDKVVEIITDLEFLIQKYTPEKAVIEKLYFTNNSKTAIDVAWARGAIIYQLKHRWLTLEHYTPLELKKAICGNGKANKLQLQKSIQILFSLDSLPKPDDAADAIGLAYMWCLKINKFF